MLPAFSLGRVLEGELGCGVYHGYVKLMCPKLLRLYGTNACFVGRGDASLIDEL